jgi:hypothetical protein
MLKLLGHLSLTLQYFCLLDIVINDKHLMWKCDPDNNLNMWMGRQTAYCVQKYNMLAM